MFRGEGPQRFEPHELEGIIIEMAKLGARGGVLEIYAVSHMAKYNIIIFQENRKPEIFKYEGAEKTLAVLWQEEAKHYEPSRERYRKSGSRTPRGRSGHDTLD